MYFRASFLVLVTFVGEAAAAPVLFQASGADSAAIQATVDSYRTALGTLNGNLPQNFPGGRREVNWDGVPNSASSPNPFPGNFFNGNVPGRARGVEFTTPGSGFQNSASPASGQPILFANLNPSYSDVFTAFSPSKIFTPIDSNVMDVTFFSPAAQTLRATVSGFGSVFTDVDLANTTSIEYFDILNNSLGKYFVPNAPGNQTLSFFGLHFDDGTQIGKVRITTGNSPLGPSETGGIDVVAMDDFIYGEPSPVPEPGTWLMLSAGLGALGINRYRAARRS